MHVLSSEYKANLRLYKTSRIIKIVCSLFYCIERNVVHAKVMKPSYKYFVEEAQLYSKISVPYKLI